MSKNLSPNTSRPRYRANFLRWVRVWAHVVSGLFTLLCQFPFAKNEHKTRLIQSWSSKLLDIFAIQLRVSGGDSLPLTPYLLASNHISWMDIHAINAFKPIRFVAKSDVESWPIFGWMAIQLGTVFIKRDNARHGKQVASQIAKVLQSESVCIFPEGTSTIGEEVLAFKPNLFEAAVIVRRPVYYLAITYKSLASGMRSEAPAFVGEMGLLESMAKIMRNPGLVVELTFLPPAESSLASPVDRKLLALYSQEAISNHLKRDQRPM